MVGLWVFGIYVDLIEDGEAKKDQKGELLCVSCEAQGGPRIGSLRDACVIRFNRRTRN